MVSDTVLITIIITIPSVLSIGLQALNLLKANANAKKSDEIISKVNGQIIETRQLGEVMDLKRQINFLAGEKQERDRDREQQK